MSPPPTSLARTLGLVLTLLAGAAAAQVADVAPAASPDGAASAAPSAAPVAEAASAAPGAEAPAQAPMQAPIALSISGDAAIAWRGISAEEAAGAQGLGMLYPAPNAGGLLVAILTHALLVDGQRSSERSAAQARADEVLQPHAATIADLGPEALLAAAQAALPDATRHAAEGRVIEMRPSFALAPDGRTLVLDNVLRVHDAATPAVARFEQAVRVVADPLVDDDPQAAWAADGGRRLRTEVGALLAHSIAIALFDLPAPDAARHRTQRYRFGTGQKMERGQPVATGCDRVVLRTLRESFLSVPTAPVHGAAACTHRYALE